MEKLTPGGGVIATKHLMDFKKLVKDESKKIFTSALYGENVNDKLIQIFLLFSQEINNILAIAGKAPQNAMSYTGNNKAEFEQL